jgi:hypothetical protein
MQRTQNIPGSTTILTVSNEDVNTIPFEDITSNTLDCPVFDSVLDIVSVQAKLVFLQNFIDTYKNHITINRRNNSANPICISPIVVPLHQRYAVLNASLLVLTCLEG